MDVLILFVAIVALFVLDALANRKGYESREDFVQAHAYSYIR